MSQNNNIHTQFISQYINNYFGICEEMSGFILNSN